MLTINADHHPLMRLMHKPERDPATKAILPAQQQDKRSVVPLLDEAWDTWLTGTPEEAMALLELPPPAFYRHGPEDQSRGVALPT